MCLLAVTPVQARDCHEGLSASTAIVHRVVDGDTILLTTQQRVRIIGLDTLEMNAKDPQDRQLAMQAKNALDQLLTGKSVNLLAGRERKDRYGRLLAHVKLPEGHDAAEKLIEQGLGIAVGVGRNTACAYDNIVLENKARSQNKGLWKDKGHWWRDATDTRRQIDRGFHVIRSSIVSRSGNGKKTRITLANGLNVKLGSQWPLDVVQTDTLLASAEKQIVEVRGWIGGQLSTPELSLHHPANLQTVGQ